MTVKADMTAARDRYARETQRRVGRAISDLAAVRWANKIDVQDVLRSLGEQAAAAQSAGFPNIERLCHNMEEYLDDARQAEEARLVAVVTSMLDSCRTIQMHAEAVANSLRRFGDGGAFHPSAGKDASRHIPPAAVGRLRHSKATVPISP